VLEIDKARLFKGEKGTYLDTTVFIDLDQLDQYGNSGMITQDVSKEEKQQGIRGNILGNCKVFWSENGQAPQQVQQPQQYQQHHQVQNQAAQAGLNHQRQQLQQPQQPNKNQPQNQSQNQNNGYDDFDGDIPFN